MTFPTIGPDETRPRAFADRIRQLMQGKMNLSNKASVTLATGTTTTTLTDPLIGPASVIIFMPTTANAAAGLGVLYVSSRSGGSATLTHASNAQADRTYAYAVLG